MLLSEAVERHMEGVEASRRDLLAHRSASTTVYHPSEACHHWSSDGRCRL